MAPVERYAVALKLLGDCSGKRVLDVGCSVGELEKWIDCFAVDSKKQWVKEAKKELPLGKFFAASAEQLPFRDNSFDKVVLLDVLEHLKDEKAALKEIKRVAKIGGELVISVPCNHLLYNLIDLEHWLFPLLFGRKRHSHYSKRQLRRLLEENGFAVAEAFEIATLFSACARWFLFPFDILDYLLFRKVKGPFGRFWRFFINPLIGFDFSVSTDFGAFLFARAVNKF